MIIENKRINKYNNLAGRLNSDVSKVVIKLLVQEQIL